MLTHLCQRRKELIEVEGVEGLDVCDTSLVRQFGRYNQVQWPWYCKDTH